MVNSKKMSKSTVAIVLLSLLLVLSLILTATGAWFTTNGTSKSDKHEGSYTFADFITLSAAGDDGSAITAKTEILGVAQDVADGKLHPGDKILVTDGAKLSISASDDQHSFWYVVITDGNTADAVVKKFVAGTDTNKVLYEATLKANLTDEGSNMEAIEGGYQVKTSLKQTDVAGDSVSIVIPATNVEIRACQYNNVANEEAAKAILITNWA